MVNLFTPFRGSGGSGGGRRGFRFFCIFVFGVVVCLFGFLGFRFLGGGDSVVVGMDSVVLVEVPTREGASAEQRRVRAHASLGGQSPLTKQRGLFESYRVVSEFSSRRISLVLCGLGLDEVLSLSVIRSLSSSITLCFSSSGSSLDRLASEARSRGFEVILQVPFEPLGYRAVKSGFSPLLLSSSISDTLSSFRLLLDRFVGYPIVMSYLGGRFLHSRVHLLPLFRELSVRGLGWLDEGIVSSSISVDLARSFGLASGVGDVVIDSDNFDDRLLMLRSLADRDGEAIGVVYMFDGVVERLSSWVGVMDGLGYSIVPVSNLLEVSG